MDAYLINPDVDYLRLHDAFVSKDWRGVYDFLNEHCDLFRQRVEMLKLYLGASDIDWPSLWLHRDNLCPIQSMQWSCATTTMQASYNQLTTKLPGAQNTDVRFVVRGDDVNYIDELRSSPLGEETCLLDRKVIIYMPHGYITSVQVIRDTDHTDTPIAEVHISGVVDVI